jgi:Uma2 family endonuclease
MQRMSTRASDCLDAINHLPGGATVVFHGVGWQKYTEVLEELKEHPHFRISYDFGRLEVMSPPPEHDYYADSIRVLVRAIADEFGINIEGYGSTTWRREPLGKGAEAKLSHFTRSGSKSEEPDDKFDPLNASRHPPGSITVVI